MRYLATVVSCSSIPLIFDETRCIGCLRCVEACQTDLLLPSGERGRPPVIAYPGECWYCGACVMECPVEGAVRLRHPLMNQARFVPAEDLRSASEGDALTGDQ
ncbi:MAG: ferredoxin family protein [Clostridia bacterium]|nr:ferredoxin family protein [Clostridia bacterium]